MESIHALVNLGEKKDPYTKRHSVKVSRYATQLAKCVGLSKKEIEIIRIASILHDVGKIGIREEILLKNGVLTIPEYEEIKKHSEIGAEILKPIKAMQELIPIVRHHHESYDGTGYPDGLKGHKIPLIDRIICIADTYDALTSERAYRKAYSPKNAIEIMESEKGKKFDPVLLENFLECLEDLKKKKI
ncbi:MAG: HD-GYP domain-containing protein [Candidatus Omnitrophota bacterium]